jgi:hypothetical protein
MHNVSCFRTALLTAALTIGAADQAFAHASFELVSSC